MNGHLSSASLKSLAKGQLLGKYGTVIGAFAIHMICVYLLTFIISLLVETNSVLGYIIYFAVSYIVSLIAGIFVCGESYIYLKITCNQPVSIRDLFWGFSNCPDKILKIQAVLAGINLICNLPALLSIIVGQNPGNPYFLLLYVAAMLAGGIVNVILSLMLSQCYFLMLDFPQYSAKEVLAKSCKVMKGNKGRLFYIDLSFIPLFLLGLCGCCIPLLWVYPYLQAVKANFYLDLMKKRS